MSLEERRTAARRLNDRLAAAHPGWGEGGVFARSERMLGDLVSRVALAQNGHEPQFVSTDVGDESLRVTVFLENAVIDASFKEDALIVDVLPFEVRSLRVTATQDVLDDERFDPEQPLAVNVTIAEGRTLTLRGTGADDDELTRYLPILFAKTTG